MKVVIAIDSFKGSLSSLQAGTAAATGIYRVDPKVETVVRPLADGGEGTVQALTEGLGGRLVSVSVTGPAGNQVICPYVTEGLSTIDGLDPLRRCAPNACGHSGARPLDAIKGSLSGVQSRPPLQAAAAGFERPYFSL